MRTFDKLLDPFPGELPGDAQRRASESLQTVLAASYIDQWTPADATPPDTVLVIGIASWSLYELRLLDLINGELATKQDAPRVVVFDIGTKQNDELLHRIPFDQPPLGTPMVGYWRDGHHVESAWGYAGRHLIYRVFGLDPGHAETIVLQNRHGATV